MSNPPPQEKRDYLRPGDVARSLAAKQTDPAEVESLLRSAATFDEADKKVLESLASLEESIRRSKQSVEAMRRRDHLPTWVVIAVLLLFFAFLGWVAASHYS